MTIIFLKDEPFIAFSSFADTELFYGCHNQCLLSNLQLYSRNFCTTPFDELKERYKKYGFSDTKLAQFCFEGLFSYALLTKGYVKRND